MHITAIALLSTLVLASGCGDGASTVDTQPAPQLTGPHPTPAAVPEGEGDGEGRPGIGLGFLLTSSVRLDNQALIRAAAASGITLVEMPPAADEEASPVASFQMEGGGILMVMPIDAPHPDAAGMARTPLTVDEEGLAKASAHFIVTAMNLQGDVRQRDTTLAKLVGATVQATDAIGAMLGHGVLFYKADLFAAAAKGDNGEPPMLVSVDLTMAAEGEGRMSVLSHGMERYGREEFYVTASQTEKGALDFTMSMVTWLLYDADKELPTGDTVGRSAEEKLIVQRVANPTGEGPEVIRLDLP